MARPPEEREISSELLSARSNARHVRARMEHAREYGLTPQLRADRTGRLTDVAARSLRGGVSDFREVEGDGDALGIRNFKVKAERKKSHAPERQGRSDIRPGSFHKPAVRPMRLKSDDGRTSFHFSHEAISKILAPTIDAEGRVVLPGQAKGHQKYIEREGAVARDPDALNADGIELENLTPFALERAQYEGESHHERNQRLRLHARHDAVILALQSGAADGAENGYAESLAGLRGLSGLGLVRDHPDAQMLLSHVPFDRMEDERGSGDGVRSPRNGHREDGGRGGDLNGLAAQAQTYIERQEAIARQPDGSIVLFTNIDDDPDERAKFWELVEDHERAPDPDRVSIQFDRYPAFWSDVIGRPDCPPSIKDAYDKADHSKPVKFLTGGNESLRSWLADQPNYVSAGKREKDETNDEYNARKLHDAVTYIDGRGGRIQYRLIGELPYELDTAGRIAILKKFCQEFEDRKLPYTAVMHAPDHTNDDRNWHFHIVYHDRPASRVTSERIEQAQNAGSLHAPVDPHTVLGRWDFSVHEMYIREGRAEKRWYYPFEQKKIRQVSNVGWVKSLRDRLAKITNDEMQAAGLERRVDPGKHCDMDITAEPQEHLGSKASNLEAMGTATAKGSNNEAKQWAAVLERIARQNDKANKEIDKKVAGLERELRHLAPKGTEQNEISKLILRYDQHAREAAEHKAIAEQIAQHMERLLSRSTKVIERCEKQIDAIQKKKASRYLTSRRGVLLAKLGEAQAFAEEAGKVLEVEREYLAFSLEAEKRNRAEAESTLKKIADAMGMASEKALDAKAPQVTAITAAPEKSDAAPKKDSTWLTKAEMDAWINGIHPYKRLLIRDGQRLVPAGREPGDDRILAAPNYKAMAMRLNAIQHFQGQMSNILIAEIKKYPGMIARTEAESETSYTFNHYRKDTRDAFAGLAKHDPALRQAAERAIAIKAENDAQEARERQNGNQAPQKPQNAHTPSQAPTQGAEPVPQRSIDTAKQDRDRRNQIADRIASEGIRVTFVAGKGRIRAEAIKSLGIADADFADTSFIQRLEGISKLQDRELKRLAAYGASQPDKLRLDPEAGIVSLAPTAPRELVALDRKWRNDPDYQKTLSGMLPAPSAPAPVIEQKPALEPVPVPVVDSPIPETTPAAQPEEKPLTEAQKRHQRLMDRATKGFEIKVDDATLEKARLARKKIREAEAAQQHQSRRVPLSPAQQEALAKVEVQNAIKNANQNRGPAKDPRGQHQLIDNWLEGIEQGIPAVERQVRAAKIMADQAARAKLAEIERGIAARIRDDARRLEGRGRGPLLPGWGWGC